MEKQVIIPSMLTLARMSRGKSIKDLAIAVNQKPSLISRFEHGQQIPINILTKISETLDYPVSFFTHFCIHNYLYNIKGEKTMRKYFVKNT